MKAQDINKMPMEHYYRFECLLCEKQVLVEADHRGYLPVEDWPNICPYCQEGMMFLDMKHQFIPVQSTDVRTQGVITKTEEIEIITHI